MPPDFNMHTFLRTALQAWYNTQLETDDFTEEEWEQVLLPVARAEFDKAHL